LVQTVRSMCRTAPPQSGPARYYESSPRGRPWFSRFAGRRSARTNLRDKRSKGAVLIKKTAWACEPHARGRLPRL
jgi:hypothetical protein